MNDLPLFAAPAPEEVREIHQAMASRAEEPMQAWREWLRGYALAHLTPVSTDDLWRAMDRGLVPPIPEGSSPNVLGSVFSGDPAGWRRVGFARSTRNGANGNLISEWLPVRATP
jgi:hypothetical protein